MTAYEKRDLILTGVNLFLTLLAVVAAFIFGYEQILINKQLVSANYEPALLIQYSKPKAPTLSGISILNQGKSNITLYSIAYGGATSTNNPEGQIIDTSQPKILQPGLPLYDSSTETKTAFSGLMNSKDTNVSIPIYVYFKTGNGQKYIMETWVHVYTITSGLETDWGPINYDQFNWSEK